MIIEKFFKLKPEGFGLDISDLSLKLVKLKKRKNKYQIEIFGEHFLEKGIIKRGEVKDVEKLAESIKEFITKMKNLKTKYVVASLPEEKSFVQIITLPKMSENQAKQAVLFEAEHYIPYPIEKVYLDSQIVPSLRKEKKETIEALVVALPKETVDPYLLALKKANLIPLALEVESQAIARSLIKNETSFLPYLLIDIGATRTTFVIFGGKTIRFTASIPISSTLFTKAIANNLKIDFQEAEKLKIEYGLTKKSEKGEAIFDSLVPILTDLKEQIAKYIDFYHSHISHDYLPQDGSSIKKIILCGRGANLLGLKDFLTEELKIPIEMGNPLINLGINQKESPISKKDILGYAVAIGLAKRAIDSPYD